MSGPIKQRLEELDALVAQGTISKEEYAEARRAALGIGAPAAAGGAVVGQVMSGPIALGTVPTAVSDKLCRKGHTMALLQNTAAPWVAAGNGQARNMRAVCSCCMTVISLGSYYYMCGQCTVPICSSCVESRQYLQYSKEWTTGLCECHKDCSSFFDATACTYFYQAMLCDRVQRGFDTTPGPDNVVESGCTGRTVLLGCGLFWYDVSTAFLFNVFSIIPRQIMVRRYGIEENACTTCMAGFFCRCLSDAQLSRELTVRGHFPGGVACSTKPNTQLMGMLRAPVVPMMPSTHLLSPTQSQQLYR